MLHQTQPQVATQDHIHQTPDLSQRHIKHNLAIFHIDLRYVFEIMLHSQTLMQYSNFSLTPYLFNKLYTLQLQLSLKSTCCEADSCFTNNFVWTIYLLTVILMSEHVFVLFNFYTLLFFYNPFMVQLLCLNLSLVFSWCCFRCCGGMDCNCVSDLLLPPVPALWTPGLSLCIIMPWPS